MRWTGFSTTRPILIKVASVNCIDVVLNLRLTPCNGWLTPHHLLTYQQGIIPDPNGVGRVTLTGAISCS